MSGSGLFSYPLALLIASSPLAIACGGEAVDGTKRAETAGTGSDLGDGATATETGGTGSDVADAVGGVGTGGTGSNVPDGAGGAVGSSPEQREAASERAAHFVNDHAVLCKEEQQVRFGEDQVPAYPTRVLQTRGRPGPYALCAEIADADERLDCILELNCDFDWWNELDWSQWNPGATVVEIVGVRPEQINVADTTFQSLPLPDGSRIGYVSFYERPPEDPVPPGSHDCGYYWYLDPTPGGVALVLGPPLAGDLEGGLSSVQLNLCLTE